MVRSVGRVKLSQRGSRENSPVASPNLQEPLIVKKGIDEEIKSPEPDYLGSPPPLELSKKSYTPPSITLYNEKDIKQKLTQLYEYKDMLVKDLSPDILAIYQYLQSYVRILYETDEYTSFYQCVKDVFKSSDTKIRIGSVSHYFVGCTLASSSEQGGCSVICAGALPVPSSSDTLTSDTTCKYPVYIGLWVFDLETGRTSRKVPFF